ncbi:MAG: hypothetical protein OEO23_10765 [Gemmatimonadota bacterium]|nr:hypothetical protein [Gemmatimonadota bacterium]
MFVKRGWLVLAAGLSLLAPERAWAQYDRNRGHLDDQVDEWGPPRAELLLYGTLAVPVGEFQSFVNLGGGGGMGLLAFITPDRNVALKLDGTFVVYGSESIRVPLSPTIPFVDVDVRTTNYIASLGVGPQVYLSTGSLRPYVYGTVGFSYFATQTSVSGTNEVEDFASTTNFDDFTLALTGGGGLSVQLSRGEHPVALDFSAGYQRNGLTEYLTEGDLIELPGGGWAVDPIRSETNLMSYRIGVSIGVR